jgi:hypothetical protein
MSGRTVITSKEPEKLVNMSERPICYVESKDNIIWKFKTEDEAIRAAKQFMNAGFEYVKREV